MAYKSYINRRHRVGRDEDMLVTKMEKSEATSSGRHKAQTTSAKTSPAKHITTQCQCAQGGWRMVQKKGAPWPEGAFDFGPFYPPGRGPYVPELSIEARIQYRKCGCKRVSTNHRPGNFENPPCCDGVISPHLVNYANRKGGHVMGIRK